MACPGCCAARRRLRRGALLIRGPSCRMETWVPALRRTAEEALHRIRDTRLRQLPAQRALRLLGRDDGLMELACRRNGVPRMLRSAPPLAAWCAADPGPILPYGNMGPGSAAHRRRGAAPRPGHETAPAAGSARDAVTRPGRRVDGVGLPPKWRAPDAAQRAAFAAWCAAGPGSILPYGNMGPGSAAHRRRGAAPHPGHETAPAAGSARAAVTRPGRRVDGVGLPPKWRAPDAAQRAAACGVVRC